MMSDEELKSLTLAEFATCMLVDGSDKETQAYTEELATQSRNWLVTLIVGMLTPLEQDHFATLTEHGTLWQMRVFLLLRDVSMQELVEEAEMRVKKEALLIFASANDGVEHNGYEIG